MPFPGKYSFTVLKKDVYRVRGAVSVALQMTSASHILFTSLYFPVWKCPQQQIIDPRTVLSR